MKRILGTLAIVISIAACKNSTESTNKFSDPVIIRIADLKDRRVSDSLYQYLTSENPVHRKEAALAFGSIQDTLAVEKLAPLLNDNNAEVRQATAFSLGQSRCKQSAVILEKAFETEKESNVLNEMLEAYGKVAKPWKPLTKSNVNPSTYTEGLAWSLYRGGSRVDTSYNSFAANLLSANNTENTRLGAAHFFSRVGKNFDSQLNVLANSALNDSSVDVQMAATLALRKIKSDSSFMVLEKIHEGSSDYRVKVNAIRAMQAFPFSKTKNYLLKSLSDKKQNVAVAASEAILATAAKEDWIELANQTSNLKEWRAQANLYQAILRFNDNSSIVDEIKSTFKNSINDYQKAALIAALQELPSSFDFIQEQLFASEVPIIKTTSANALVAMNYHPKFKSSDAQKFADVYTRAMQTKDPAVIGAISSALQDSTLGYRTIITDFKFLYDAKGSLSLPKDNETLQSLDAAIAYFEKKEAPKVTNEFNHPIDWNLVKTIPKDQTAIIKTNRGNITIKLFVEESPGSVANFISLSQKDYFDKKYFHRVVPNFVVQGGCTRGDGSGSEDYSIRSEFGLRKYKTGSVGMASAGKDTEGTQWFITHSPTPHLDGGYTVFAEVVEGIEAAHLIGVGDQILDVEIVGKK
jgi:cyclophilin family peptidyl-prolyl cis-trans isomerase/HEAT repeat protein